MHFKAVSRTLTLLFLFAGISSGPAQETADPFESREKEALQFMRGRQFGEALPIFRDLVRLRPDRRDLQFLRGMAALQHSLQGEMGLADREALVDEAIATFRAMLIEQPGLVRVRLELARAFFYKGEDGLSQDHFERVLAGNPPAPVVANVRRFLALIRARRRWNMHLGFALAPDTNIGGGSDKRYIYIGGLRFRRNEESLTKSGIGLSVWGGGEYQHPLGERVRLRLGMDASRREYSGSKFDSMLVSLYLGPRTLMSPNTEFSVLGNWRHRWSAKDSEYFDLGGQLAVAHRLTRRVVVSGRASRHERRYHTDKALDGPVQDFSLSASWVLTPTMRLDATTGYGYNRPDTRRHRNRSILLQTRLSVALPKGFTVGGGGGVRWTAYQGDWFPHTPSGISRDDRTYNLRASVHNRALTFFGFSPEVSLIHEVRKTNAQLYDYKRTGGELRVVRQF